MRKELGKWLMDIAKYLATAVLLSSVFSEQEEGVMYIIAFLAAVITLFTGLILVRDKKQKEGYPYSFRL